ncbi:MAG: cation transporter [Firmicutes bacterium]|nr:cation transporter [Bacillota bacterium]
MEYHGRERIAFWAGAVGIASNLLLFAAKLGAGLWANSISIISDAFNNLTDLGSAVVAVLGVKLSSRPPDKEHPHGHGRYEYVAALIVSFIIFTVGLELLHSSVQKVLQPEPVGFSTTVGVVLILSIAVKLGLFVYNRSVAHRIGSSLNRAVAFDSLSDALATTAVLLGALMQRAFELTLDGYFGMALSLLIMYTGFSTAKESVNLLVGISADPELVKQIETLLLSVRGVKGAHELRVHDYGPGRTFASVHAEVDPEASFVDTHAEIDKIEERIAEELGVKIVIHMEPVLPEEKERDGGGQL